MRKKFAELLAQQVQKNDAIYFLTADLGFKMWDRIQQDNPKNYVQMGSSEQLMLGTAIGMAYSGKIPVCYSISTFLINRPFEWIRNFINYENLPVKLVGSGRDRDYAHDGWTHWPEDDEKILSTFENFQIYKPNTIQELEKMFEEFLFSEKPCYLNLKR
jgi:transketolase